MRSSEVPSAFESVVVSARGSKTLLSGHAVMESAVEAMRRLGVDHLAHQNLAELSGGQRQLGAHRVVPVLPSWRLVAAV